MSTPTDDQVAAGIAAYQATGSDLSIAPEVTTAVYVAMAGLDASEISYSVALAGVQAYRSAPDRTLGAPLVIAIFQAMEAERAVEVALG